LHIIYGIGNLEKLRKFRMLKVKSQKGKNFKGKSNKKASNLGVLKGYREIIMFVDNKAKIEMVSRPEKEMLVLNPRIGFSKDFKVVTLAIKCNVNRPTCLGCKFEKHCDELFVKILSKSKKN